MKKNICFGVIALWILFIGRAWHPCEVKAAGNDWTLDMTAGNADISDADACVFVIMGDGFTEDEQTLFSEEAGRLAAYVLAASPFSEEKDYIKMYALGTVSEESGVRGDRAQTAAEAVSDTRDTLFKCSYFSNGEERLLAMSEENEKKAVMIARQYVPDADFYIVLANAGKYGGSGGVTAVTSLHENGGEILLHELGHSMAGLGDEYWPGAEAMEETPNTTMESDPQKVPWSSLIGQAGIGVYAYADGGSGWYKPSENCKMEFLGKEYAFCAVCRQAIKDAVESHTDMETIRRKAELKTFATVGCALILFAAIVFVWIVKTKKKN